MLEILEFALSGFWKFAGCLTLFYCALFFMVNGLLQLWSRFMRTLMVRKHGWPPSHLDADGDWNQHETP